MADGLIDFDNLKKEMKDPPFSAKDQLENILEKGIDYAMLTGLKSTPIPDDLLKDLKQLPDDERIQRLELLVERLLVRVARIEEENETRMLENISISLSLSKYMSDISPMIAKIFTHFFGTE